MILCPVCRCVLRPRFTGGLYCPRDKNHFRVGDKAPVLLANGKVVERAV